MHKSITTKKVIAAAKKSMFGGGGSEDFIGFCIACGKRHTGVEGDARGYTCEKCGKPKVYGAEELLMYVA